MEKIEMEYSKLEAKIAMAQGDKCDKYDYLIAVGCGSIAGLIDIFLVGSPTDSKLQPWTDNQVNTVVKKFANKCGWKPKPGKENNVNSAIGFLEKKFKVNYDQRHTGDVDGLFDMSTKNHHMKSLAHSPDIVGLFFSILNQFTSTSSFLSDGRLITIETETQELQGHDLISKIFCGATNWFGHLMSDIAGSSGATTRGSGIVIPFFELFQLFDFGRLPVGKDKNTIAMVATKAFQSGYDARFGLTMAIPLLVCELLIKVVWSFKQYFYYKRDLKDCIPTNKHSDLRIMLIVGNGTLCLMDAGDAAIRSGGNAVAFVLRLNYVAWLKLSIRVIKEIMYRYDFTYEDLRIQYEYLNFQLDKYINELKSINYVEYENTLAQINDIDLLLRNEKYDSASLLMTQYIIDKEIDTSFKDKEEMLSVLNDENKKLKF